MTTLTHETDSGCEAWYCHACRSLVEEAIAAGTREARCPKCGATHLRIEETEERQFA